MITEARKKYEKEWRLANKEKKKEQYSRWRLANKERLEEYDKEYYKANKERQNKRTGEYQKQRRAIDPGYRLLINLRNRHRNILKGITSTTRGLGCDGNFLREHLENQWTEGMNWDNYGNREGQWSLDHILPLTLYYSQPELLPQLIHYSNMQPMWHTENIKKSNNVHTSYFNRYVY